jgi:uncharacterized protein YdiU (UPF0061 family)
MGASNTIYADNAELSSASRSNASQEKSSTEVETRLNGIVREAVSQGLSHFGGKNVVESLFYILELDYSVDMRNVVNDLESLHRAFEKMFGNASYVVEERVRNNLAKILGLDPEDRSLEELIEAARQLLKSEPSLERVKI